MFTPPSAIDPGATASRGLAPSAEAEAAVLGVDETFAALRSTRIGLSAADAAARSAASRQSTPAARTRFARIRLPQAVTVLVSRAFAQVADPVHLLLLFCAVAAASLGAPAMAVAFVVLTTLRVLLLAAIEARQDEIQSRLRQARAPRVSVRRDGVPSVIDARDVVVGDVIELAAGTRVPADARLFELEALVINHKPVDGQSAMAWTDSWVTSGRGAAVVTATGPHAAGAALSRLDARRNDRGSALPDDAGSVAASSATQTPLLLRLDRANAVVLATAVVVLIGGMLRGSGGLHSMLAAVAIAAMAWSAQARLARPLRRLTATQGAHRLLAAGVFVRDIDVVDRLACLPAGDDATAPPAIALSTAGTDDTDRARLSADVVFNVAASQIPPLAALAIRGARSAVASADRALAFGVPSARALLLATALLALALGPSWPASVPLALHVLLFALCITLALAPLRGSTRAPAPLPAREISATWVIVLPAASLAAARLAAHFSVDAATLAVAAFVFGCVAFNWVVASEFGSDGWALRRPLLARPRDATWLALGSVVAVAAVVAAVHVPRWQSAFETAALSRATWGIAAGLALAASLILLAAMYGLQWRRRRSTGVTTQMASTGPTTSLSSNANAASAIETPTDAKS